MEMEMEMEMEIKINFLFFQTKRTRSVVESLQGCRHRPSDQRQIFVRKKRPARKTGTLRSGKQYSQNIFLQNWQTLRLKYSNCLLLRTLKL